MHAPRPAPHNMSQAPRRSREVGGAASWTLDSDATSRVLPFLGNSSLATLACVSRALRGAASCAVEWERRVQQTWVDKDFQPAGCLALLGSGDPKRALRASLGDCKRTEITGAELSEREWCFRFKETAGEQWTEDDPWWQGGEPWRVRFLRNGKLQFCGRPGPNLDGGGLEWEFTHGNKQRGRKQRGRKQRGSFVQVTLCSRGGGRHPFPRYDVCRHAPNWGWFMHSYWCVYSMFDMPHRGGCARGMDDETLATLMNQRHEEEADQYNEQEAQ